MKNGYLGCLEEKEDHIALVEYAETLHIVARLRELPKPDGAEAECPVGAWLLLVQLHQGNLGVVAGGTGHLVPLHDSQ